VGYDKLIAALIITLIVLRVLKFKRRQVDLSYNSKIKIDLIATLGRPCCDYYGHDPPEKNLG